jgi:hypothetical protein
MESLLSFGYGHGPPSAGGLTHRRLPIPARDIGPTLFIRRVVDAFVYAERFVAPPRLEGAPTMTVGIKAGGKRLDRITQAFETIGGRMERARFARHPANNDLSTPVAETGDAAWEISGESLLARRERQLREVMAFELSRPAGKGRLLIRQLRSNRRERRDGGQQATDDEEDGRAHNLMEPQKPQRRTQKAQSKWKGETSRPPP